MLNKCKHSRHCFVKGNWVAFKVIVNNVWYYCKLLFHLINVPSHGWIQHMELCTRFAMCWCVVIRCGLVLKHILPTQTIHYIDVIMGTMASQITSLTIVYLIVHSGADQRKHQSSASLAFVRGIHRWPVNSPHKWPVTRKMFPFDDVIMMN